ncbi:MAG: YdeI/OmpD-associated family protein [Ignavibacteriales bacterium]|nr:YdeI/OmpD-associated family protein [Ignavibacteriales bacterium]
MIDSKKMTKYGLKIIQESKQNGKWNFIRKIKQTTNIPDDLKKSLLEDKAAWDNFNKFPKSSKTMYIYWINDAKKVETRLRRIKKVVERAKENKNLG